MFLIISPGFSWISLFGLLSFYFEYEEKKYPNPAYILYSLVWMNVAEFLFWLKLNIYWYLPVLRTSNIPLCFKLSCLIFKMSENVDHNPKLSRVKKPENIHIYKAGIKQQCRAQDEQLLQLMQQKQGCRWFNSTHSSSLSKSGDDTTNNESQLLTVQVRDCVKLVAANVVSCHPF